MPFNEIGHLHLLLNLLMPSIHEKLKRVHQTVTQALNILTASENASGLVFRILLLPRNLLTGI